MAWEDDLDALYACPLGEKALAHAAAESVAAEEALVRERREQTRGAPAPGTREP